MTRTYSRPQRIAWILLVVGLVAVWSISFRKLRWETCAEPDRLVAMREIPKTETFEERGPVGDYTLLFAWVSGEIERPTGDLNYQVMRSDQVMNHRLNWHLRLKRLYQPESTWVETIDVDGESIPIHWSSQRIEYGILYQTAQMHFLGTRPIRTLIWDLVASAPGQLAFGTLPITSYVIEIAVDPERASTQRALATDWLEAVARRNREICAP